MAFLTCLFWTCAALVGYAYVGYPLLLALAGMFRNRPIRLGPFTGSVSIVLVVHNEEANLERRLGELTSLLQNAGVRGEIVVVSDGSTDNTHVIAATWESRGVRLIAREVNEGKAAALTAGCLLSEADVLVFADARQRWAPHALERLLENFADPSIGGVSGDLVLETAPGVMAGVGMYWRMEKWLRKKESQIYSQVGVTGAISAVRRELFKPIPAGTLLDDVYWPLQVAMQGQRVVHDDRAMAYDRLPENPRDEFRRKVRTLAGNFQLLTRLPGSLFPWRNPVWVQWVSHKLLRLAVPWALIGLFVSSVLLGYVLDTSVFFQAAFWVQAAGYVLAIIGLLPGGGRVPLAGTAASFLVLNAAAWLAFFVWITGRAARSWRKVAYQPEPGAVAGIADDAAK